MRNIATEIVTSERNFVTLSLPRKLRTLHEWPLCVSSTGFRRPRETSVCSVGTCRRIATPSISALPSAISFLVAAEATRGAAVDCMVWHRMVADRAAVRSDALVLMHALAVAADAAESLDCLSSIATEIR